MINVKMLLKFIAGVDFLKDDSDKLIWDNVGVNVIKVTENYERPVFDQFL